MARKKTRKPADGLIAALDRAGLADKARIDAEIERIERRLATLKLASRLLETKTCDPNDQAVRPRSRKPQSLKRRPLKRKARKSSGGDRLQLAAARREKIAAWLKRHGPAGPAQIAEGLGFTFRDVHRSLSQGNGTLFKQLAPRGPWTVLAKSPDPQIPKSLSPGAAAERLKPAKKRRVLEQRREDIHAWLVDHAPASVPMIAQRLGMHTKDVRDALKDKRFFELTDHQWENADDSRDKA